MSVSHQKHQSTLITVHLNKRDKEDKTLFNDLWSNFLGPQSEQIYRKKIVGIKACTN